jgi:hypothetical protein
MGTEAIHDYNLPRPQGRGEHLLDAGLEVCNGGPPGHCQWSDPFNVYAGEQDSVWARAA